jgi:hypothetical protein
VMLSAQGLGHQQIADRISEHPTSTAVGDALALDRQIKLLGLKGAYVPVLEPPADYTKLRRLKNQKYRFTPLEGYVPPAL